MTQRHETEVKMRKPASSRSFHMLAAFSADGEDELHRYAIAAA